MEPIHRDFIDSVWPPRDIKQERSFSLAFLLCILVADHKIGHVSEWVSEGVGEGVREYLGGPRQISHDTAAKCIMISDKHNFSKQLLLPILCCLLTSL